MTTAVVHEKMVELEGAYYIASDAEDVLELLLWMQVHARSDQMTLTMAMWHFNALTPAMADSIRRAAIASGKRLPANYRDLVGPVCRARKGNTERIHLFGLSFTKS